MSLNKIFMTEVQVASPQQFRQQLDGIFNQMLQSQQKRDYVEADRLRQQAIRQQLQWEHDYLQAILHRRTQEQQQLEQNYHNNVLQCERQWSGNIEDYLNTKKQEIQETDRANNRAVEELRKSMTEQWPAKVKESYQLLNLREMEHHMSKQKQFDQANLIQQRINQLYQIQLKTWHQSRDTKIQQAVTNLRSKQNKERELLNKKMQIKVEDDNNKCRNEKISLQQRFNLSLKEMKAEQQREMGSFRREFKNKGGFSSQRFGESRQ